MNILITGGSGFIGRYVTSQLKKRGHNLMIYDLASPAFDGAIYCHGSMLDDKKLTSCIEQCDAVMHLAGLLGTSETLDDPVPPAQVNIIGSLTVFQACRRLNLPCCYICVGNHFMLNTYAITKTCAERFALMFNKEHGTRIAVVRGLNAYGPYQKHKPVRKVIPNFILPALRGSPLTIYGNGKQVMDFIYVEDLAEILCRALLDEHGCYDRIFEAGSGRITSINEIARAVLKVTESISPIHYKPMRPGEDKQSTVLADITTLAPLKIDPETFISLEEGLRHTAAFYRAHILEYV